jgi:hypothetical protein
MASMTTRESDEAKEVASHTLAYLRSLDRKVDLILETQQRHTERLARTDRDLLETKGDMVLPENKILTNQMEILAIVRRLDVSREFEKEDGPGAPSGLG